MHGYPGGWCRRRCHGIWCEFLLEFLVKQCEHVFGYVTRKTHEKCMELLAAVFASCFFAKNDANKSMQNPCKIHALFHAPILGSFHALLFEGSTCQQVLPDSDPKLVHECLQSLLCTRSHVVRPGTLARSSYGGEDTWGTTKATT